MKKLPDISIIIITLNSAKTIDTCLTCIEKQNYPSIKEILIIDGGSSDKTESITKKHTKVPISFIKGGYKNNQEARRAIGLEKAKSEFCISLDSDNYIFDPNWITDMIQPLIDNKDIVATQTLRYGVEKKAGIFNRYFALMGAGDPAAYYLKKADRLSWAFDKWNLLGTIIGENEKYYTIQFDPDNYPTLGCNGLAIRKSAILQSNWEDPENYFHTDVFVDIAKKGLNTFGIVKNDIYHDISSDILYFFSKRKKYMEMHHQAMNHKRRYVVFDPKRPEDIKNILLFVLFSVTLIEPLFKSIRGFIKRPDIAWFLHPIICLGTTGIYGHATLKKITNSFLKT